MQKHSVNQQLIETALAWVKTVEGEITGIWISLIAYRDANACFTDFADAEF